MDHEIHIECDCHYEMITLSKFDKEPEIYLCVWSRGHWASHSGLDIRNKLRWIWRIIRNGHPYADEIVLSIKSAKRMMTNLNRMIAIAEDDAKRVGVSGYSDSSGYGGITIDGGK